MNRVQGDYFETLLYKIFVSIDEQTNVAEVQDGLFSRTCLCLCATLIFLEHASLPSSLLLLLPPSVGQRAGDRPGLGEGGCHVPADEMRISPQAIVESFSAAQRGVDFTSGWF